jgi:hypothetical protein
MRERERERERERGGELRERKEELGRGRPVARMVTGASQNLTNPRHTEHAEPHLVSL